MKGIWDLAEKKKKMMEDQKRVGGVMFAYSLEAAHHSSTSCTPFGKPDAAAPSITTSSIEHQMHFYEWRTNSPSLVDPTRIHDRDAVLARSHCSSSYFTRLMMLLDSHEPPPLNL